MEQLDHHPQLDRALGLPDELVLGDYISSGAVWDVIALHAPGPPLLPWLLAKCCCPAFFHPSPSDYKSLSQSEARRAIYAENAMLGADGPLAGTGVVPRWYGLYGGVLDDRCRRQRSLGVPGTEIWVGVVERVGEEVERGEAKGRYR